jgi:hypothetical protein
LRGVLDLLLGGGGLEVRWSVASVADLVLALELSHDDLVGVPDVLLGEEAVHLLEGDVAGFGEEHDDVGDREDLHRREEEVDAVAHVEEHGRSSTRDDEVPCERKKGQFAGQRKKKGGKRRTKPVRRGSEALSDLTDSSGEGLRVDDPRSSVPRNGVESGPEVEEEHGSLSTGGEGGGDVLGGVGDLDVGSDGEHGKSTTNGTDEKL